MKKYSLIYALVLSLIACPIEAQTGNKRKTIADEKSAFEAYKKQKSQDFADYKSQKQREFDEYRRKKNEEFAEYVRKRWEGFNGLKPKPKPKDQDKPPVVIKAERTCQRQSYSHQGNGKATQTGTQARTDCSYSRGNQTYREMGVVHGVWYGHEGAI